MPKPKEILLISYTFPPVPGIGGRRWAKFSKYLAQAGYRVHVITTAHLQGKASSWEQDVAHENIIRHEIPSGYPELKPANNLFAKIRNRLTIWRLMASTQGTIYDRSIFWHAKVLNYAKLLLKRTEIKNVIVSGAPFHLFFHIGKLKDSFPHLQLMLDYRDPWTSAVVYGMQELSPRRMQYEQQMELKALKRADVVIGPTDPTIMVGEPLQRSGTEAIIQEVQHAFDPDDLPEVKANSRQDDRIRLVYGGSLYVGVEQHLRALATALDELETSHPALYRRLEFRIFTREQQYQGIFKDHPDQVQFFQPVSASEIFQQVADADICLLFLGYHNKDFRTTKFFEFLTLRKPFLLLGDKGRVASYIETQRLGTALVGTEINAPKLATVLPQLAKRENFQADLDLRPFSFPAVTEQLIRLLSPSTPNKPSSFHAHTNAS